MITNTCQHTEEVYRKNATMAHDPLLDKNRYGDQVRFLHAPTQSACGVQRGSCRLPRESRGSYDARGTKPARPDRGHGNGQTRRRSARELWRVIEWRVRVRLGDRPHRVRCQGQGGMSRKVKAKHILTKRWWWDAWQVHQGGRQRQWRATSGQLEMFRNIAKALAWTACVTRMTTAPCTPTRRRRSRLQRAATRTARRQWAEIWRHSRAPHSSQTRAA